MQMILKERGTKWNRVEALAGDWGRLKAPCKPSTPTGRRGLTK
jgi:hypothetical protein